MTENSKQKKKPAAKKSGMSLSTRLLIVFWCLFFFGIISVVAVFSLISNGKIGYLPSIEELQNPKDKFASEIYSSDMKVLGRFFHSGDNRVFVPYKEISDHVVKALIATEDVRFYNHSGIDMESLPRVFVKTVIMQQKSAGGGSTISQQLAKLLFSEMASSKWERAQQKLSEWVIATKLEKLYTKEEIISMYLNKFDFLNNAVGIQSAAHVYFNTTPQKLKIEEAALLVGILKNPSYFNPKRYADRCLGRRNVVFDQMAKAEFITQHQADSLKKLPVVLDFQKVDHKLGLAPYFREQLRVMMNAEKPDPSKYRGWQRQAFYEDSIAWEQNPLYGWCNKNLKPDGSKYNLYTDGLKIYTTIDSRMQRYAEESVKEYLGLYLQPRFSKEKSGSKYAPFTSKSQMDSIMNKAIKMTDRYYHLKQAGKSQKEIMDVFHKPVPMSVFDWAEGTKDTIMSPYDSIRYNKTFLRCGMMSMDPFTGYVKSYVGGIDFKFFQYDMVSIGRRQVGSTIKPFLYTLAMDRGMSPCDEIANVQPKIMLPTGEFWEPRNNEYVPKGGESWVGKMINLKQGLMTSNNWISAYVIQRVGPENFVNFLRSLGIKLHQIDAVPSLCLGVADFKLIEMVSAYTAFANKGIQNEPIYVTRIEDNNGNTISTFSQRMSEVFSEETADKMIAMLRSVIDGSGRSTGIRLRSKRSYAVSAAQIAGKTGTTQKNADGWFMGFVPKLVTGVWVGGEDIDVHFRRISDGQGSNTSLPIWGTYMNKVYNDITLNYSKDDKFDVRDAYNCTNSFDKALDVTDSEDLFE